MLAGLAPWVFRAECGPSERLAHWKAGEELAWSFTLGGKAVFSQGLNRGYLPIAAPARALPRTHWSRSAWRGRLARPT